MVKRNAELNSQANNLMNGKEGEEVKLSKEQLSKLEGTPEEIEKQKEELREVLKLASQFEKQEEEEMLRKAIEESERQAEIMKK